MTLRFLSLKRQPGREEPGGNFEQRMLCALIFDASGSMSGSPINQVNGCIKELHAKLKSDEVTERRVEFCMIRCGGTPRILMPFAPVEETTPPAMEAGGDTPLAEAVLLAYDAIERRYDELAGEGIEFHPAMIIALTDGQINGSAAALEKARNKIRESERHSDRSRRVAFFAFGTSGADMNGLAHLSLRPPFQLSEGCFEQLFVWVAQSLKQASVSKVGEGFDVDDPEAAGFATKIRLFQS